VFAHPPRGPGRRGWPAIGFAAAIGVALVAFGLGGAALVVNVLARVALAGFVLAEVAVTAAALAGTLLTGAREAGSAFAREPGDRCVSGAGNEDSSACAASTSSARP
jgi:hypothetical protein